MSYTYLDVALTKLTRLASRKSRIEVSKWWRRVSLPISCATSSALPVSDAYMIVAVRGTTCDIVHEDTCGYLKMPVVGTMLNAQSWPEPSDRTRPMTRNDATKHEPRVRSLKLNASFALASCVSSIRYQFCLITVWLWCLGVREQWMNAKPGVREALQFRPRLDRLRSTPAASVPATPAATQTPPLSAVPSSSSL